MPIGMMIEFAAPKVADEIAVWARFCRFVSRNRSSPRNPNRPMSMAISAPTTEVLAEIPSVVMRCRPISDPSTDSRTVRTRGSRLERLGVGGEARRARRGGGGCLLCHGVLLEGRGDSARGGGGE
jgi:hypothetical protein